MVDPRASARRTATLVAVPAALLAGLVAFAVLGGFDRSPSPAPPSSSPLPMRIAASVLPSSGEAATLCRTLVANLPPSAGESGPAVTVRCGGPQYAATTDPADRDDGFYVLSGVCWYAVRTSTGSTWSTMDRTVPIEVAVPADYGAPAQRVIAFSDAIVANIPTVADIPAGCR